jgi:hypothetical protein
VTLEPLGSRKLLICFTTCCKKIKFILYLKLPSKLPTNNGLGGINFIRSTVQNDYEMTLDASSVIQLVDDVADIPAIKYNAVVFSKLGEHPAGAVVDVLAVVKEVGAIQDLMSKAQKAVLEWCLFLAEKEGCSFSR